LESSNRANTTTEAAYTSTWSLRGPALDPPHDGKRKAAFETPDFKEDARCTLRQAIDARERHIEMHEFMNSIRDHSGIPATFDGQIPAYAFNPNLQRIAIGERYMMPDKDRVERPALLTSAQVLENERVAYCGVTFDDGRSVICSMPLSHEEIESWRQYPDTFFGVVGQRHTRADTPLELYDFFLESYQHSTKDELLEFLRGAPDFKELSKLDQPRLASLYAERMTNAAGARNARKAAREVPRLIP
jgi:hypothetical protein